MNKLPVISVIMPVYKAEAYIEDSVKSILNQSFKEIEIICINDCSPDKSLEKLLALQAQDARVKVVDLPQNVGAGAARNAGIAIATGEYITFVDADDVIEDDLYQKAYEACRESGADQVVWGLVEDHFDQNNNIVKRIPIVSQEELLTDGKAYVEKILELEEKTLFGYLWNSMYRAEIIKKYDIRINDAIFYEDYFFNLDFAKHATSLQTLEYVGYHYAKRPNSSITHQFAKNYFELSYERIRTMYEFCIQREYTKSDMYNILGNRLLRYTLSALARNSSQKAGLSSKEQRQWFGEICEKDLYKNLVSLCIPSNVVHGVLRWCICHKNCRTAVVMGNMINKIRG